MSNTSQTTSHKQHLTNTISTNNISIDTAQNEGPSADMTAIPTIPAMVIAAYTGANTVQEFARFQELPCELRLMIWRMAALQPRTIEIVKHTREPRFTLLTSPAVLHVCKESRNEILLRKIFTKITYPDLVPFYFNLEIDTLEFEYSKVMPTNGPSLFDSDDIEREDLPAAILGDFSHSIKEINMAKKIVTRANHIDIWLSWLACVQFVPQIEELTIKTNHEDTSVSGDLLQLAAGIDGYIYDYYSNEARYPDFTGPGLVTLLTHSGIAHSFTQRQIRKAHKNTMEEDESDEEVDEGDDEEGDTSDLEDGGEIAEDA